METSAVTWRGHAQSRDMYIQGHVTVPSVELQPRSHSAAVLRSANVDIMFVVATILEVQ